MKCPTCLLDPLAEMTDTVRDELAPLLAEMSPAQRSSIALAVAHEQGRQAGLDVGERIMNEGFANLKERL